MYYPYYPSHYPIYQNTSSTTDGFPDTVNFQGGIFSRSSNRFSGPPATAIPSLSRPKNPPQAAQAAQATTGDRASTPNSNTQKPQAATSQAHSNMAENNNAASKPTSDQPQPQHPQYSFPYPMYPYPPYPAFQAHGMPSASNPGQEHHSPQPDPGVLAHYLSPHPRMYPYVPPGSHTVTLPPMPTPSSTPGQLPQGRQSAGYYAPQSGVPNFPPMGPAHPPVTSVPPSQDPDKLKCSECGRVRSSRYRWKHRILPGRPAKLNICRKCRKTATDSEDEGVNSGEERARRRKSQRRHRSRARTSRPRSRARSSSQLIHTDYHTYLAEDESSSNTDESEYDQPGTRSESRRHRESRSSSGEVVRYRKTPVHRSRSRSRRVVYVDAPRDQVALSDSDREVEVRYINHGESGPVVISRPPTPAARPQSTQPSIHHSGAPIVIEHREYYHEPRPPRHLLRTTSISELGSRNPYRQVRSTDPRVGGYDDESYGPRVDDRYYEVRTDGSSREHISGKHARSRDRRRVSIDKGAESELPDPSMYRVPSPPLRRRRSASVRIASGRDRDNSSEDDGNSQRWARASSKGRPRSEVDSRRYRGDSRPVHDYDWYDKDGMKVRVRQI